MLTPCKACAANVKHTHHDPAALLAAWVTWAEEWGDRDMLQALVAATREHLTLQGAPREEGQTNGNG